MSSQPLHKLADHILIEQGTWKGTKESLTKASAGSGFRVQLYLRVYGLQSIWGLEKTLNSTILHPTLGFEFTVYGSYGNSRLGVIYALAGPLLWPKRRL